MEPSELGKFVLLNTFHWGIFLLADSLALQGLIKFGSREGAEKKVNLLSLMNHIVLTLFLAMLFYFLRYALAGAFEKPQIINILPFLPLFVLAFIPRTYTLKMLLRHLKFSSIFWLNAAFFAPMTIMTFYYIIYEGGLNFGRMVNLYIAGSVISSTVGILLSVKYLKFSLKGAIRFKEYLNFSLPMALHAGFHSVPRLADTVVLTYFFDFATVGVYGFAKQIFRFFDEAGSAASGLVYPAIVRQLEKRDKQALSDLLTKSTSFLLLAFAAIILVMELGLTEVIIKNFLPSKYFGAIPVFNVMMLSALGLPLIIVGWVIVAEGRSVKVMTYSFLGAVSALAAFVVTGIAGNPVLLPLGMIAYNFVFGLLCFHYVKRNYGFPINQIFRAIPDSIGFMKNYMNKRKKNESNR